MLNAIPFLLDTNSYYLLFQYPRHPSYQGLIAKLKSADVVSFYISELTSLEIHSVVGKYRRGSPMQSQFCDRRIIEGGKYVQCHNTWICPVRRKMKSKVYRDILKLISDIEAQKGDIQATVIKLDCHSIEIGRKLLKRYADRFAFGSHDALIAGSLITANQRDGLNLTLMTSDKSLKAVLREESISCHDPVIAIP